MRKSGLVVGLVLCLGLLAVAQAPTLLCRRVVPVALIDLHRLVPTTEGWYLLQLQNTTANPIREFILVFPEPVIVAKALTINGGTIESISGSRRVWQLTLTAPLAPGLGWLFVSFTSVLPVDPMVLGGMFRVFAVVPPPGDSYILELQNLTADPIKGFILVFAESVDVTGVLRSNGGVAAISGGGLVWHVKLTESLVPGEEILTVFSTVTPSAGLGCLFIRKIFVIQ